MQLSICLADGSHEVLDLDPAQNRLTRHALQVRQGLWLGSTLLAAWGGFT